MTMLNVDFVEKNIKLRIEEQNKLKKQESFVRFVTCYLISRNVSHTLYIHDFTYDRPPHIRV